VTTNKVSDPREGTYRRSRPAPDLPPLPASQGWTQTGFSHRATKSEAKGSAGLSPSLAAYIA